MKAQYFFLLFLFATVVYSFNFDTNFPTVFKEPVSRKKLNSYFGYTVAMYPGMKEQWFKIGAPKAYDNYYPKIDQPGMVYNCYMSGCHPIEFPHSASSGNWSRGWTGGTMDISFEQEKVVVCGYRHFYKDSENSHFLFMAGACFWSFLNVTDFHTIQNLFKTDKISTPYTNVGNVFFLGLYQAGFSVHLPAIKDGDIILGAPGTLNWAGSPIRVKTKVNYIIENRRKRDNNDVSYSSEVLVPNVGNQMHNGYFGYSVTSGYYFGGNNLYYASGSPRADEYKGKVSIFEIFEENEILKIHRIIHGRQFGEYFGATVESGNVNGDKFDDILIGAPFYKGSSYNEGRVYVYLGSKDNMGLPPTILYGHVTNGQFGTSIMYLGDITGDNFGDVAIGAPYEDNNGGIVYIYKGSYSGLMQEIHQKIVGKDIFSEILGFGITISKAVDMTQNGVKDVTIGAHLSGHAVFLRSLPIIVLEYSFRSMPPMLLETTKECVINICFSYSVYKNTSVDIKYEVNITKGALLSRNDAFQKNLTVFKNKDNCQSHSIKLNNTHNVKTPLHVLVSYELNYEKNNKSVIVISDKKEQGMDNLCITCPVIDIKSSTETPSTKKIEYSLDCGEDMVCHSHLTFYVEFPTLKKNRLVLGSTNNLAMNVIVVNSGEHAYSSKLYIQIPEYIYFSETTETAENCKMENGYRIFCDMGNLLKANSTIVKKLELDLQDIQSILADSVSISCEVTTASNNTNKEKQDISLTLIREADITIYGTSDQETNFYGMNDVNISSLTHTYKVEKFGISYLKKVSVKIQVPHSYLLKNEVVKFLDFTAVEAFFDGQPLTCNITGINITETKNVIADLNLHLKRRRRQVEVFKNFSNAHKTEDIIINNKEIDVVPNNTLYLNCSTENVFCFEITCSIGLIKKANLPASIKINLNVKTTILTEITEDKNVVLISSNGEVSVDDFIQYENRSDSFVISSMFTKDTRKHKTVAVWIIIVAVIGGLLLLLILILFLIKMGFFKRSEKEKLLNLIKATEEKNKTENMDGNQQQQEEPLDLPFNSENGSDLSIAEETETNAGLINTEINTSRDLLCDK